MASPLGNARVGRRALVAALSACALALMGLLAMLARDAARERAAAPQAALSGGAPSPGALHGTGAEPAAGTAAARSAVSGEALAATRGPVGPFLTGRVLDETGRAIADGSVRIEVHGPLGQRLAVAPDGTGGFGPLRLVPGAWVVRAGAAGRRAASADVELGEREASPLIELVLARVAALEVHVSAMGSEGRAATDLAGIVSLLSLRLAVAGETDVATSEWTPVLAPTGADWRWRARFERLAGRPATLTLCLGSEPLFERGVAAGQEQIELVLDPLELTGRLVELEVELRDPRGAPLEQVTHVALAWRGGGRLVAGQPGPEPWRARFAECPPGAARLFVSDADLGSAAVDVFVPHASPARLEVTLELERR